MRPNYTLITPPTTLRTKDPLVTVASDTDTATLDLRSLQPRLHKRLTAKVRAQAERDAHLWAEEVLGAVKIE
jgi:hypothetical protein